MAIADWKNKNKIPRADLVAWHHFEPGVSDGHVVNDYSGNGYHLAAPAGDSPVLQFDVTNGQPGWYFDGSVTPLISINTATAVVRHAFILAAAEGSAFDNNRGLLSGASPSSGDLLVSNSSGDTFFDLGYGSNYSYRKAGLLFANNNQKAPMGNALAVIEVRITVGVSLSGGIQVGQQRDLAARDWKGYWLDEILYGAIKDDVSIAKIYEYFAMRYQVWSRNADGLAIFPFAANRSRSLETSKESYISEAYDGDQKALVRGNFRGVYELPFLLREQEEYEAALAFYKQHYPLGKFVFRDYRFSPARESIVRFASPIREQGGDVSFRFNYSFDIVEA